MKTKSYEFPAPPDNIPGMKAKPSKLLVESKPHPLTTLFVGGKPVASFAPEEGLQIGIRLAQCSLTLLDDAGKETPADA